MAQMKDLQANLAKIQGAGVQLVGISYDAPETLMRVMDKHGLTFTLLADVGSKTIDAYGIRNEEAKGRAAGVAHPVLFLLDQQGVVRAKLMRDNYRERPEVDEIVAAAMRIMQVGTNRTLPRNEQGGPSRDSGPVFRSFVLKT